METIGPGQIELKVHGLVSADNGRVPARVFANKLKQFVLALEAADYLANGQAAHAYILTAMHMSQPTAVVKETKIVGAVGSSEPAYPLFQDAIEAIKTNNLRDENLKPVVSRLNMLASGTETQFGFAEIRDANSNIIRIDSFLKERAYAMRWKTEAKWFHGVSYGSFDGYLKYIDTRGSLPQIKIRLSAGGRELDCVCKRDDIDAIGVVIDQRVRIFGKAIYSSSYPLPIRVEVSRITPVPPAGDFTRWNGAFRPFDVDTWDAESAESAEVTA